MSRKTDKHAIATATAQASSPSSPTNQAATPQADPILAAIRACEAQRFDEGMPVLEEAVRQLPLHIPALLALGAANGQLGKLDEARKYFERVLEIDPKIAVAHTNLGNVCRYSGDIAAAAKAYRQAIDLQPGEADAHYNLAGILTDMGEWEDAEVSLRRAILFRPQYAEAYNNLGDLMMRQGRVEDALKQFRQALVWRPEQEQAQNNMMMALYRLGMWAEADLMAKQKLEKQPNDRRTMLNQAMGLLAQGKQEAAEAIYRKLTELDPEVPDAWVNLGSILQMQARHEEAIAAFETAMELKGADRAICISGVASVMLSADQPAAAAAHLKHATMLESRHAGVVANLGAALIASGEVALGIEATRTAVSLVPSSAEMRSALLFALSFDHRLTPAERYAEARIWNDKFGSPKDALPEVAKRTLAKRDRLRIGFVSPDFRNHSVATCLLPLLKHIDKSQFEITCYATSGHTDDVTLQIKQHADNWRQVSPLSHIDFANRIRNDGIDVLIDLSWHTGGNRLSTFALRPAPVQISWLGFFASTGMDAMNARLSDDVIDPANSSEALSSETILRLPVAMPFQVPQAACDIAPQPAKRNGYVTYACISRFARANASVLDAWAEILLADPTARMIIMSGISERDAASHERIRRMFLMREIEPDRIDIKPKMPLADFLSSLTHDVDIVLDTFPYCGGVTTVQALWMGVPTVTLAGASPYERTGASLLQCAGLSEFVAENAQQYVDTAIARARDIAALGELRTTIRSRLEQTPILDGAQFARQFESTLLQYWQTEELPQDMKMVD